MALAAAPAVRACTLPADSARQTTASTRSAVSTGAAAPLSSRFLGSRVPTKAVKAVQVKGNWKAGAARATATADPSTSTYVVPDLDRADALMLYEDMVLGRTFEDMCAQMYYRGKMFGFVHLYNGQEAVSSGIIKYLRQDDYVTSTYRDHVHALSKGVPAREVMAELYGKTTGCCRGQGGSMHMFSKEQGVLGGFAFIGEGIPVAVGAAFTVKYNKEVLKQDADQVSVAFFGDGTCNNGSFYECLNMAALWKLPVIFVVENNLWAIGMSHLRSTSDPAIWKKGPAFGMPGVHVDGMDVLKVREVALEAIDRARRGDGPTLIECETYRFRGHSLADPDELRSPEEKAKYAARDPIIALKKHILETGLATEADLKAIEKKIDDVVEDAVEFADESPLPERHQLLENDVGDDYVERVADEDYGTDPGAESAGAVGFGDSGSGGMTLPPGFPGAAGGATPGNAGSAGNGPATSPGAGPAENPPADSAGEAIDDLTIPATPGTSAPDVPDVPADFPDTSSPISALFDLALEGQDMELARTLQPQPLPADAPAEVKKFVAAMEAGAAAAAAAGAKGTDAPGRKLAGVPAWKASPRTNNSTPFGFYPYDVPKFHPLFGMSVKAKNGTWYTYVNLRTQWRGTFDWATGFWTCRFTAPHPKNGFNCKADATCPGCPYCRGWRCFRNMHLPTYGSPNGQTYVNSLMAAAQRPKEYGVCRYAGSPNGTCTYDRSNGRGIGLIVPGLTPSAPKKP
ncbi:unnamed protein product [Closterium sp. Naga37s-1]|nr:unnamed protein product [Closterium sp. Naga37s-1]